MHDEETIGTREPAEAEVYTLKLYVAGRSSRSQAALANLRKICKEKLAGRCQIEVVDLLESPGLAKINQIVAIPTLVRELPASEMRVVGDLSDTERVFLGLDLHMVGKANAL